MNSVEFRGPAEDELVAEKFRLTRLIGRGGMGSVWEGVHVTLGTKVAVKFIDAGFTDNDEARQRFENEAKAAARLDSKYAVKVFDHGMMADRRPFIVMEYLAGEPLDARLQRLGHLEPSETAQILSQVCRALSRAHAAGIVHRDLKPENVFLVRDEEDNADIAKVVDFGIAKFTDHGLGISSSTRTGSVLGTPFYMSPEQARGLRDVDYRTDLWSLGVIAYRCIVGRLPFESESLGDLLVKICTAELPVPSQVVSWCPGRFDAWFARAMQRDPSLRFGSAQELAEQLMLVSGVAPTRRAQMSSHDGYQRVPTPQQAALLAGLAVATNPVVEGTTAPRVADTGGGFAQTRVPSRNRRNAYWAVGGGIAILSALTAVAAVVLGPSVKPSSGPDSALGASAVVASAAPTILVSSVASSVNDVPIIPNVPSVAPVDVPPNISAETSTKAAALRGPAAAVRPPPVRPAPAGQRSASTQAPTAAPKRPSGKSPIDLGY